MRGFLLIVICVFAYTTNAQTWTWARKQQTSGLQHIAASCTDNYGAVYIAGYQEGSSATSTCLIDSGFFLLKYTAAGAVEWQKKIFFLPKKMIAIQHAIILAGTFFDSVTVGGNTIRSSGHSDMFLAGFNSTGQYLWSKGLGGINEDVLTDVASANERVYVSGYFFESTRINSILLGSSRQVYHSFLMSLTEGGEITKVITDEHFYAANALFLKAGVDGSIYTSGRMAETDSSSSLHSYVSRYSKDLELLKTNYSWGYYDLIDALAVDIKGQVYIQKYSSAPNAYYAPRLQKLDGELSISKDISLGGQFSDFCLDKGISCDGKGGMLVSGFVLKRYPGQDSARVGEFAVSLSGGLDILLARYDEDMKLVWVRNIAGEKDQVFNSFHVVNGKCYVSGMFNMDLTSSGVSDTLCFQNDTLTADGSWPQMFLAQLSTEPLFVSNTVVQELKMFPNPAIDKVFIGSENSGVEVQIISAAGSYSKERIVSPDGSLDIADLTEGVYFLRCRSNNRQLISRLIIAGK